MTEESGANIAMHNTALTDVKQVPFVKELLATCSRLSVMTKHKVYELEGNQELSTDSEEVVVTEMMLMHIAVSADDSIASRFKGARVSYLVPKYAVTQE